MFNPSWLTAALLLLVAACAGQAPPRGSAPDGYEVTIRRDAYGVPQVVAPDWGSLGYGEGFAFAQDHACTLADQVVRARGDRARSSAAASVMRTSTATSSSGRSA